MRIVFWGTSTFAVPALRALHAADGVELVAVVTQPDKPHGRHGDILPGPVAAAARELGLTLLQPETVRDETLRQTLEDAAPDVAVVAAYGRIIPEALLAIPRLGTLNIHPSLLPRWRGPSPIQAAIAHGDAETGVSIMLLDAEMDHGPLLAQRRVPLSGTERYPTLETHLAEVGAALLLETVPRYVSGGLRPVSQDHDQAVFCGMLDRDSGRVDWSASAVSIARLDRAYDPWPGIWTEWTDGTATLRVKLFDARVEDVVADLGALSQRQDRLLVGAHAESVSFGELQVEGKKRLTLTELLRGMPMFLDGRFR